MPSAFLWPMLVPSALRAPAPVNLGVMPQTKRQAQRVGAMVENCSLVCETKHDANSAMKAGSVVAGGVRFEKMNAVGVEVVAHLKPQWLPSKPRLMKHLNGSLLAGLGAMRGQVERLASAPARFAWLAGSSSGFSSAGIRSNSLPVQSMPSLLQLAARIAWPVPSLQRAGITRRSSGLASPAA